MTCDTFLDRLYDEDARLSQRGLGPIPPDMVRHMRECEACRAAHLDAIADERLLTRALHAPPPPGWQAEVLRQIAPAPRGIDWTRMIATVNEAVTWGVLWLAASRVLGDGSTAAHVAAFCAGAATALLQARVGRRGLFLFLRQSAGWA